MSILYHCNFIILFGHMLFPLHWVHWVLCFSIENHNSRQKIIIMLCKYVVDIRSEAPWLNLFWEFTNWKLIAVCLLILWKIFFWYSYRFVWGLAKFVLGIHKWKIVRGVSLLIPRNFLLKFLSVCSIIFIYF